MNKNRATKSLSILLAMCMLLGMLPMTALADNFSDIKGHWAESQINEMINEGIVKGYPDGSFKPDGDISRAEFVSLIVKAFKLTKAKGKDFDDISNHWAKDAILTANAHGIVNGYSDTKFGPDDPITREQMAVIIVKVAHLTDNSKGKTFVDSQDISEWAKKAVAIASSNQLITGYPDNTFKPSANTSRAEATAVLSKSIILANLAAKVDYSLIEKSGKYGPETGDEIVKGDVVIKAKDTILQNLVIKGDLTIAKEVGDGDVTLNNIKVEGKTYIRGGGIDSIHINGGEYREIIIERTITGAARILTANVQRISITISENDNGEDVILNGEIKTVTIKADGIKVISQGKTTIDKIEVTRGLKDVKIELTEDTEVKEIILDSKVDVKGKGEIEKASGSKIRESTFVTAPKRIITPSTGGNGSSSSGGTSTTPNIKVSAISITTPPTKTIYEIGDPIDLTGLVVTATYSDNSSKTVTITSGMISGFNSNNAEVDQVVTVTYEGKTATFNVTIKEAAPVVDKTALTAALAEADSKMKADYTAASWTEFQTDLATAKAMSEGTQAEVDAKFAAVNAAIAKLVEEVPVVDTTPPVISGVSDKSVLKDSTVDVLAGVTAMDNVDGPVAVTANPSAIDTSKVGTTVVTYTATDAAGNTATATATFTVVETAVDVTGVTLDQTTMSLTVGGATGTLTATVAPAEATNKNVSWSSSNEGVATVSNGVVTPVSAGTTTITVTTDDGNKTATCDVTVTAATIPVTGVTLDQTTMNLTVGGATGTLTATVAPAEATNKNVSWSSSNEGVATVSNGVVTPVSAGTTTITVTTDDGNKTATCDVTVTAATIPVTGVTLDQTTMNLTAGGATGTLTATVTPEKATNKNVSWSSSNEGVATVSNGVVTPVAAGSTTITVTTTDGGKTATCTVTVESAPDKVVTLKNIPGITIPAKDGVPVTAVGANDQYTGTVEWSPSVVDNKFGLGQIYTATITLTAKAGYTLEGIAEANFFSVIGADSTTYDSSSKTVTVKFPTTGDKPAQTGSPKISGSPVYGVGLMADSEGLEHVFGGVTYTWYRSEDANFDESTDTILDSTGTSGQNYTIVEADIGKYLIVKAVNPNSTGYGFRVVGPVVKANVVGDVEGSISAYYLSDGNALYIRGINPSQGKLEVAVAIDGTTYGDYQVIGTNITEKDITGLSGVDENTKVKIRKAATNTHNASEDKVIAGTSVKVRHKLTLEGEGLTVDKTPDVFGEHKTYADNQYLKLTVTPPTGNVIDSLKIGVEEKRDSLNGNNELWFHIIADTTITVTYTEIKTVNIAAIEGVTAPEVGATPVTSITETAQYTGTITWYPNQNPFVKDTEYTATITLTAKHSYSFDGVAANFFKVAGATSVTNAADSGVVKAVFPKTGAEQVTALTIYDSQVAKPQKGEEIKADPFTSYGGSYVEYDGTIKWYEEGNETEATGFFKGNTVYIAKVSLEARDGYTFAGLTENSFQYTGATSIIFEIDSSDPKKGLLTITFPATEDYPEIENFAFTATANLQESNANVAVGAVAGTFDEYVSGGTSPFTFSLVEGEGGADNGKFVIDGTDLKIIEKPLTEGTYSVRVQIKDTHDKTLTKILTFYVSAKEAVAPITDTPVSASPVTVGQTLADSTLSGTFKNADGDAVAGTLAWTDSTTVVNATGNFEWTFTPDDQVTYNVITGDVNVVANPVPAVNPVVDEAVAATAVTVGQTLADSTLSGTFKNASNEAVAGTLAWTDSTTVVNATGDFQWTFTP
ncbi:HYR domain-containing protein, partial [Proteiniborus ethanoligenes]